jgi:hypothetical protein
MLIRRFSFVATENHVIIACASSNDSMRLSCALAMDNEVLQVLTKMTRESSRIGMHSTGAGAHATCALRHPLLFTGADSFLYTATGSTASAGSLRRTHA